MMDGSPVGLNESSSPGFHHQHQTIAQSNSPSLTQNMSSLLSPVQKSLIRRESTGSLKTRRNSMRSILISPQAGSPRPSIQNRRSSTGSTLPNSEQVEDAVLSSGAKCPNCPKFYKHQGNLFHHLKLCKNNQDSTNDSEKIVFHQNNQTSSQVSTAPDVFQCDKCESTFPKMSYLRNHQKRLHKDHEPVQNGIQVPESGDETASSVSMPLSQEVKKKKKKKARKLWNKKPSGRNSLNNIKKVTLKGKLKPRMEEPSNVVQEEEDGEMDDAVNLREDDEVTLTPGGKSPISALAMNSQFSSEFSQTPLDDDENGDEDEEERNEQEIQKRDSVVINENGILPMSTMEGPSSQANNKSKELMDYNDNDEEEDKEMAKDEEMDQDASRESSQDSGIQTTDGGVPINLVLPRRRGRPITNGNPQSRCEPCGQSYSQKGFTKHLSSQTHLQMTQQQLRKTVDEEEPNEDNNMEDHLKTVESSPQLSTLQKQPAEDILKPFTCDLCASHFKSKGGLTLHRNRKHHDQVQLPSAPSPPAVVLAKETAVASPPPPSLSRIPGPIKSISSKLGKRKRASTVSKVSNIPDNASTVASSPEEQDQIEEEKEKEPAIPKKKARKSGKNRVNFDCPICGKHYMLKKSVERHIQTVHKEEQAIKVDIDEDHHENDEDLEDEDARVNDDVDMNSDVEDDDEDEKVATSNEYSQSLMNDSRLSDLDTGKVASIGGENESSDGSFGVPPPPYRGSVDKTDGKDKLSQDGPSSSHHNSEQRELQQPIHPPSSFEHQQQHMNQFEFDHSPSIETVSPTDMADASVVVGAAGGSSAATHQGDDLNVQIQPDRKLLNSYVAQSSNQQQVQMNVSRVQELEHLEKFILYLVKQENDSSNLKQVQTLFDTFSGLIVALEGELADQWFQRKCAIWGEISPFVCKTERKLKENENNEKLTRLEAIIVKLLEEKNFSAVGLARLKAAFDQFSTLLLQLEPDGQFDEKWDAREKAIRDKVEDFNRKGVCLALKDLQVKIVEMLDSRIPNLDLKDEDITNEFDEFEKTVLSLRPTEKKFSEEYMHWVKQRHFLWSRVQSFKYKAELESQERYLECQRLAILKHINEMPDDIEFLKKAFGDLKLCIGQIVDKAKRNRWLLIDSSLWKIYRRFCLTPTAQEQIDARHFIPGSDRRWSGQQWVESFDRVFTSALEQLQSVPSTELGDGTKEFPELDQLMKLLHKTVNCIRLNKLDEVIKQEQQIEWLKSALSKLPDNIVRPFHETCLDTYKDMSSPLKCLYNYCAYWKCARKIHYMYK